MARISLSEYLRQCEETDRFDGGYALELVIQQVPAEPEVYDPFEILARLEEQSGISISELERSTQQDATLEQLISQLATVVNQLKKLNKGN